MGIAGVAFLIRGVSKQRELTTASGAILLLLCEFAVLTVRNNARCYGIIMKLRGYTSGDAKNKTVNGV